jgi:hypothetical protein
VYRNANSRSFSYHLNAWEPATFLLRAYSLFGDRKYFDTAYTFSKHWLETFQVPAFSVGLDPDKLDTQYGPTPWYDMGVGLRAYRIAYMLDVIARDPGYPDEDVDLFLRSLKFHLDLLLGEGFFKPHSNHGLYQALGHVAASRRFSDQEFFARHLEIARNRMREMIDQQFHASGMHKEHSPGYHYILMGSFISARESGLIDAEDIFSRISLIEAAMTWLVQPNSEILSFGDTDRRDASSGERYALRFENEELRYLLSAGKYGLPPDKGLRVFDDAGYAFARLYAPDVEQKFENASYLAQIAAFHSRVHKHADHLGFIWFDRKRDILIDPGRYAYAGRTEIGSDLFRQGFWYSDPKRVYVESTRAHNCVEIDGKSYPRRNVEPFGSALRYAGEQSGLAVTDCEVVHPRTTRHRRVLVMAPGHFLLVLDWLHDRTKPHDYRQWFQFAPQWTLEHDDERILARSPEAGGRSAETLTVLDLIDENTLSAPIRGQEEPELQGWMSDAAYSLVPCTSLAVEAPERPMARFATLFVFGDDVVSDRKRTRFNASMRNGAVHWSDGKGEHVLTVEMGEPGTVSAILATTPR